MAIYKEEKKKTWKVVYNNTTKRGFKTKREAQIYEANLKAKKRDKSQTFYSEISQNYLNNLQSTVSYGTYDRTRNIINNHILTNILDKKICDYTYSDCVTFRNELANSNYSTSYKNSILQKFTAIFELAVNEYDLASNPAKKLIKFSKTVDENKKERERFNSLPDEKTFLNFLDVIDDLNYKAFFYAIYSSGMRKGECLALQWSAYDEKNRTLDIHQSITPKTKNKIDGRQSEIVLPKTAKSIRTVVVNENLYNFLKEIKAKQSINPEWSDKWFIFGGKRPLPTTSIDTKKNKAIKQLNIDRFSIHDLRHAFVTYAIANGIPINDVSAYVGHSSTAITLKTYTHHTNRMNDEFRNYLNKDTSQKITHHNG